MIKEIKCYKCLKCNTIYVKKEEARDCNCDKKCPNDYNGFHSWKYLHSFMGMAFYKCKCGKEMIGVTEYKKDPLDEIFVNKLHSNKKQDTSSQDCEQEKGK